MPKATELAPRTVSTGKARAPPLARMVRSWRPSGSWPSWAWKMPSVPGCMVAASAQPPASSPSPSPQTAMEKSKLRPGTMVCSVSPTRRAQAQAGWPARMEISWSQGRAGASPQGATIAWTFSFP